MKKFLWSVIVIIYVIIAISVTFCLLNFNDNKVTEIGDNSLVIISDDKMEPDYSNGDLIIVNKKSLENVINSDKIFFYNDKEINVGLVKEVRSFTNGASTNYILQDDTVVLEDDVIGTDKTAKVFSKVGKILSILESKWGFLFIIIFPSVIAFLNEIVQVINELKGKNEDEDEEFDRNLKKSSKKIYEENYEKQEIQRRPRESVEDEIQRRPRRPVSEEEMQRRPRRSMSEEEMQRRPRRSVSEEEMQRRPRRPMSEEEMQRRPRRPMSEEEMQRRPRRPMSEEEVQNRQKRMRNNLNNNDDE